MIQVVMIAQVWWILAASTDGGAVAQRSPVQLDVAEYRPMAKREPTAEQIRAALLDVLNEQKIPVSSSAKMLLRIELVEAEKHDDEGTKTCARVRSSIVDMEKEYLPKREMVAERCVPTSWPKVPAAGDFNWVGVADAISRASHKSDALTYAYAEALNEVIANLRRRLDR